MKVKCFFGLELTLKIIKQFNQYLLLSRNQSLTKCNALALMQIYFNLVFQITLQKIQDADTLSQKVKLSDFHREWSDPHFLTKGFSKDTHLPCHFKPSLHSSIYSNITQFFTDKNVNKVCMTNC